jgi:hypothetical protein
MNRTLPGFTADRSLYTPRVAYRSSADWSSSDGAAVMPAQFEPCLPIESECSACVAIGPAAFGRGRRFCTHKSCRQTLSGGCICKVIAKGFESCYVSRPVLTTLS